MDFDTVFLAIVAVGAGSIVKGATGIGLPVVAVPLMATWLGLPHAIAITLIPVIVSNIWQLAQFRGERHDERLKFLPRMLVAAVVGIIVGTALLTSLPARALTTTLGSALLVYLLLRLAKPNFILAPSAAHLAALPVGFGSGVLQGATGVSAPLSIPLVNAMRLGRPGHLYTMSAIFLVMAVVQIPSLYISGIMRMEWFMEGLIALLPMFACMPIGQRLAANLSAAAFDKLILAFLGIMGLKLAIGI